MQNNNKTLFPKLPLLAIPIGTNNACCLSNNCYVCETYYQHVVNSVVERSWITNLDNFDLLGSLRVGVNSILIMNIVKDCFKTTTIPIPR